MSETRSLIEARLSPPTLLASAALLFMGTVAAVIVVELEEVVDDIDAFLLFDAGEKDASKSLAFDSLRDVDSPRPDIDDADEHASLGVVDDLVVVVFVMLADGCCWFDLFVDFKKQKVFIIRCFLILI